MQPVNYRIFMKNIDRVPSLVIELNDHNKYQYVVMQRNSFQDLKSTYQHLLANPEYTLENIHGTVLPTMYAQQQQYQSA